MPVQRPQLVNGEIYHIVLRAVGNSLIFQNENDYYRGIFSIYEFNNSAPVNIWERRRRRSREKISEKLGRTPLILPERDLRDLLVEVLMFSLMPNHIHLSLRQLKDNGISQFMQKVGGGYATYFNQKYNRKGHLFSKFRSIHIGTDEQLKNLFVYIHANRISLIEPNWKEIGIKNPEKTIEFLENDKWHSYPDYLGKKNFPSVTGREFMLKIMDGERGCREFVNGWIKYKKEIRDFNNIFLE